MELHDPQVSDHQSGTAAASGNGNRAGAQNGSQSASGARWGEATFNGSKRWVISLTLLIPYFIVLLALSPSSDRRWNRILRAGLAPMGIWAMREVFGTYVIVKPDDVQVFELSMACTLSVTFRYTLTSRPPTFHPLTRHPLLNFVRQNRFFQAFNLIASDYRHVNIPPNPPLRPGRGYFKSVGYHLSRMIFYITLMDILLYPAFVLDPHGLGSPTPSPFSSRYLTNDVVEFCFGEEGRGGVEGLVLWSWFAFALGASTMVAMQGTYHLFALLGVGSGIYLDEEWPRFMERPWKADSLNDLWGKRYHQMLRDTFLLWSSPFSSLPKPIHILSIFLTSALFHAIIYKPLTSQFILTPYLTFYLLQGLGCILERALYRATGMKVGGWSGRVWMLVWIFGTGWSMCNEYYRMGWVGRMRAGLVRSGTSPAAWLAYGLGIAPHPIHG